MNPSAYARKGFVFALVVALAGIAYAHGPATRAFADGVMLFGNPASSALSLAASSGEVPIAPLGPQRSGHITYPALSRDGQWIATSYVKSLLPARREGIAIYSVKSRNWAVYGDFESVLAVSFSPDASRVAFRTAGFSSKLMLLDLSTGAFSVLAESFNGGQMSWSPDGRSLVYGAAIPGSHKSAARYEIHVMDLETRAAKRIADGSDPAWSPSGEWIAYLSNSGDCVVVHPDGSAPKTIVPRHGRWLPSAKGQLVFAPVWSPDSKQLLLNEDAGDGSGRVHVHLYDMGSGGLARKAADSAAALGWSR